MRKWGLTLLVIGIASLILPLLGLQLRIFNLFGGRKEVSLVAIGIGAVLYLASRSRDRRPAEKKAPAPSPVKRTETQESTCAACGVKNAPGDRFCGACGAVLASVALPSAPTCGNCGAVLSPEERFCGICGGPRGSSEAPHRIATAPAVSRPEQRTPIGFSRLFFFGLLAVSGILLICGILISFPEVMGGEDPGEKAVYTWASAAFFLSTSLLVLFPNSRFRIFLLVISLAWSLSGAFFVWRFEFVLRHSAPYWAILAVITGPFYIFGILVSFIISRRWFVFLPADKRKK